MADAAEIKLNIRIDPLQEAERKLRDRILKDYKVKLPSIEIKQTVTPSKPRWDAKKIEAAARAFIRIELAVIATVAHELVKEIDDAGNGRDKDKAEKALSKKLLEVIKRNGKIIEDKIAEGLEEIESDKNVDEEKALKLAGKSLSDVATVQIQSAIMGLRGEFQKTIAALLTKYQRLSKGQDAEESTGSEEKGGKDTDKGPLAAQRAKLVAETVKSLKNASDEFDAAFKAAREDLDDMVEIMKAGAKKKDIGESVQKQMDISAKQLASQIDRLVKAYRETKPARDTAIRTTISSGAINIGKIMAELPDKGGNLWKAADSMARTIESHKKDVDKLQKAAKK